MPSKQKIKGSSWEREVSKYLTELLGVPFSRSPGSGAYIGGTNNFRKKNLTENTVRVYKGDIIPGDGYEHLNFEAKSYKELAFHQLFQSGPVKQLETWINQCASVADADDLSIILIKITRKGDYILIENRENFRLPAFHVKYHSEKHGEWIFTDMYTFLETNKDQLKKI